MTIFAGAFSLDATTALPADLCDALARNVSRFEADVPDQISGPGFFLAKVDVGAFGAAALYQDTAGNVTCIAGEPLIDAGENDVDWTRTRDTVLLHSLFQSAEGSGLTRCRGTFCGVNIDQARHQLTLFVDKVGVRPLYVWLGPRYVVFATALRILETIAQVPKTLDIRGVTEIAALSYPLGDRTAYTDIKTLLPGEVIRIVDAQVRRDRYWRWDGPLTTTISAADAVKQSYTAFIQALQRRQRGARTAAAFLSGGLDSRTIVGGLQATGNEVYSVNYAPDGSQDQVFATLVAEKLGLHHTQLTTNAKNVGQGYRKDAVRHWIDTTLQALDPSTRPTLLWSGDGGSVALGHVYMTRGIVAALADGDLMKAVCQFNNGIPLRIIKRNRRQALHEVTSRGMLEEMAAIDSPDRGRAFHLFLMFNDQRRHLSQHFEDIDKERIEFQLPFFDAQFLETILRLPSEPFLYHGFYIDWLKQFPNGLDTVPWQAYPGHVPCPLPSPPGLKYQWDDYYDHDMTRQLRCETAQRGKNMSRDHALPDHLISRPVLRLAAWLTGRGWRDYSYLIKTAATYYRYWQRCSVAAPAVAGQTDNRLA